MNNYKNFNFGFGGGVRRTEGVKYKKIMKKMPARKLHKVKKKVSEYRFDYKKAKPNRFAGKMKSKSVLVLLDDDVAKFFKNSQQVNHVLRELIPDSEGTKYETSFGKTIVEDVFEFRATNVELWEEKALHLKTASNKIYHELVKINKKLESTLINAKKEDIYTASGLNSMWMLAVGYSIECLIKAIIINTTSSKIIKEKRLNFKIFGNRKNSHDLYYLINRIEESYRPSLSENELTFLIKMSSYITWRAKYPIPLSPNEFMPYHNTNLGGKKIQRDLLAAKLKNDKDKIVFDNIFKIIHGKLLISNHNKGGRLQGNEN